MLPSRGRGIFLGMLPRRSFLALLALLAPLAFAAPLTVDPASVKIEVDVHATLHGFTGQLAATTVTLDGDPATGAIATASVRFAWMDLKTGDTARDKEMVAWATAHNAAGVFTLAKLSPTSGPETFTATGTLALNGQTRDVTFPVKITHTAAGWTIAGETKIDHRDWGLPKIRKFGMLTVDPIVLIRFSLAAQPRA